MRTRTARCVLSLVAAVGAAVFVPGVAHGDLRGSGSITALPPANVQSGVSATSEPGTSRLSVFVRGTDNQIWWAPNGNAWFGWVPLPTLAGGAKGDPTVVSMEAGRLDVFVRGADDKLWQSTRFSLQGAFQPWIKPVGDSGVLASGPEAAVLEGSGRLDVFVVGTDGLMYQRFWNGASWNGDWIPHGDPAGPTTIVGDPAAVWARPSVANRLDVFVRGSDDKLWQRTWNGSAWSEWTRPLGTLGTLASSPDASLYDTGRVNPNSESNIVVVVRGTDGGLWGIDFTAAGWGANWVRFAQARDVFLDSPAVTMLSGNGFEIFARGPDNFAYQIRFATAVP